jgi:hypothetical protein
MKKKLRQRIKEAVHKYSFFGKIEEIANRRRHIFNEKVKKDRQDLARNEERVAAAIEAEWTRPQIEDLEQLKWLADNALRRHVKKREFWRDRYVWSRERHSHWGLVLKHRRDRLRRWIRQHESFQPFMANGNPYEKLTDEAKYAIYLDFRAGNFVTSTYEGFPGDGVHSTTSHHYLQNQSDGKARCWDCGAGSREPMAKAQIREAERCSSFLIEMFGPENEFSYKNGVRFTLPEGDALETMHDNHKHTCIRDGAPVA